MKPQRNHYLTIKKNAGCKRVHIKRKISCIIFCRDLFYCRGLQWKYFIRIFVFDYSIRHHTFMICGIVIKYITSTRYHIKFIKFHLAGKSNILDHTATKTIHKILPLHKRSQFTRVIKGNKFKAEQIQETAYLPYRYIIGIPVCIVARILVSWYTFVTCMTTINRCYGIFKKEILILRFLGLNGNGEPRR